MGSYPITEAAFDKPTRSLTQLGRFQNAVRIVEAAVEAGTITNVAFKDAKDVINRAVEAPIDVLRLEYFYSGKWQNLPNEVQEFDRKVSTICLYINLVPGRLKAAQKLRVNHPYCDALIALLSELLPLSEALASLKDKIVKRQPKPVEERKEGYHPPMVSTEGQKRVVELLESVTKVAYDDLVARYVAHYTKCFDEFMKAMAATEKHYSPYDHFIKGHKYGDYSAERMVDSLLELKHNRYVARVDTAERIIQASTKQADDIRMAFVHKNYRKLASIVDGKGNLKTATTAEHTVFLAGLRGTFHFTFKDGSSFTVNNSVVYATNWQGTSYNRFPLTFHNVVFPDGNTMIRPSEERMNKVFLET